MTIENAAARLLAGTDDEALVAMEAAFCHFKLVLEPGGAASLAAVLARKADFAGKTVTLIASGGNVDNEIFARALAVREAAPQSRCRAASR